MHIKTNKKSKTKRKKRDNRKNVVGGKAITSGGFGCLFNPALKCKNTLNYDHLERKMVTKLMTKKNAMFEYKQITAFKSILENIPNYEQYFLVDGFNICEPDELTKEDLTDFDEKCSALKKKKITAKNINENLSKILAINMPDGGQDIDDYISSIKEKSKLIPLYQELNTALIGLLVNGIEPMNRLKLYHCDIKGSNILVKKNIEDTNTDTDLDTRLIDWGLSVYRKNVNINHIPDNLNRRPFQFNVPFSIILFNKKFIEKYNLFLKKHSTVDFFAIREFVINYVFYWNKIRGAGHLKTINSIMKHLTYDKFPSIENKKIKDHVIEYDFTYYYIVEYISKILLKYTKNGNLNLMDYFNNVFLKNIDIWGLTIIYMDFLDSLHEIYDEDGEIGENQLKFIEKIKYIIIHFLFENPTEIIDINKLATELQSLNEIISKFDNMNSTNKKQNIINYITSITKVDSNDIVEIGGSTITTTKRRTKGTTTKRRTKGTTTNKTRRK